MAVAVRLSALFALICVIVCLPGGIQLPTVQPDTMLMADGSDDDNGPLVFITISEVNVDSGTNRINLPKRYIELYAYRNPSKSLSPGTNPLRGWRLLMIKGTTMEILLSLDLSNHYPSGPFIVIGDNTVPGVGISFSDPKTEIAFTSTNFPDMDESPYAFILTGAMDVISSDALSLPSGEGSYHPLPIASDEDRKKLITDLAYDVVVVGRRVATNQCDFFSSLFPERSFDGDHIYILRDRDVASSSVNDFSINYCCSEPMPYSPGCFKLGHPSPGTVNDCDGRRFILEYELDNIGSTRQSGLFVDQNEGFCKTNFPGLEPYRYNLVHDHDYAEAVARVMRRPECEEPGYMDINNKPDTQQVEAITVPANEIPKKYILDFDYRAFNSCVHHFSSPDDFLQGYYTAWLDVKHEPDKCLIRCRICRTYFQTGWRPDKKHKYNIQQDGFYSKSKRVNSMTVRQHLNDPIHAEALFFYARLETSRTRTQQLNIEALQELEEKKRLRPTMNEVSLGYTELRAGVSFQCHGLFMDSASYLGVDVGFKHRNDKSLTLISTTISSCFHKRLLQHLVNEQKFFSLICDGTTNKNIPYLVCLIQTLEDSKPVVYFWGLLVITTGETGYNMVEDVRIRISQDDEIVPGFENYFKSHIIASVSDSASNMAGCRNSFYTCLSDYVGRSLALIKCGAHKLQRAIIHGIDFPTDQPSSTVAAKDRKRYFKSFAKINNKFYSFYMSRGSKRFQEFVELAEEHEIPAYRINYFFDIRWAASHRRCMETMYKNYDALRQDLGRIVSDSQFEQDAKTKAYELYQHLLDKTFPVVVAEFVDFLTIFGIMSQRFQLKGGIMIGNVQIIREGYSDLEKLKQEPGSYLRNFLNKCSCPDLCLKGQCTLSDYDQCPEVLKDGIQKLSTRADGQHTIKLSLFRSTLYEKLEEQIVEYFVPETLEAFEVFNPRNFKSQYSCSTSAPLDCSALSTCYDPLPTIVPHSTPKSIEDNVRIVCIFYGISNAPKVIQDWKRTLTSIVNDHDSQTARMEDAANYWPKQMLRADIPFSDDLKALLERILVTSFTSADAERAFSMVSHIKTPDRQNLKPTTLENLVRIAFNGPDVLSEERLYEYTKEFVKVSSRVDDRTMAGGRQPRVDSDKNFFTKSKIF